MVWSDQYPTPEAKRIYDYGERYPAYSQTLPPHIGHRNHLCDLAQQGNITLNQMKELVRDPKFICRKCGRVAAKEDNLCEPLPL